MEGMLCVQADFVLEFPLILLLFTPSCLPLPVFFFHFVLQQPCKVCGIIVQNFTQEEKYYLMDEQLAQVKRSGAAKVLCPCEYF